MVYASSQDVADYFGKRHDHVLRDIDAVISGSPNLGSLENQRLAGMFAVRQVWNEKANKNVRTFDMTRDGFALVVMGYTGPKAMVFKLRYIDQFNRMEAALKAGAPAAALPKSFAEALRLAADQQETIEEQKAQLEAQAPAVAAIERMGWHREARRKRSFPRIGGKPGRRPHQG